MFTKCCGNLGRRGPGHEKIAFYPAAFALAVLAVIEVVRLPPLIDCDGADTIDLHITNVSTIRLTGMPFGPFDAFAIVPEAPDRSFEIDSDLSQKVSQPSTEKSTLR